MQEISRYNAALTGLNRYFNGKPCKKGHVCERYVANGNCVDCHRERMAIEREGIAIARRQFKDRQENQENQEI